MHEKRPKRILALAAAASPLILLFLQIPRAAAQSPPITAWPAAINSPRPLMDLSLLLEDRFRRPVTYEDPVWLWRGDLVLKGKDENAAFSLAVARGSGPQRQR